LGAAQRRPEEHNLRVETLYKAEYELGKRWRLWRRSSGPETGRIFSCKRFSNYAHGEAGNGTGRKKQTDDGKNDDWVARTGFR
jgi:hypothetical protein